MTLPTPRGSFPPKSPPLVIPTGTFNFPLIPATSCHCSPSLIHPQFPISSPTYTVTTPTSLSSFPTSSVLPQSRHPRFPISSPSKSVIPTFTSNPHYSSPWPSNSPLLIPLALQSTPTLPQSFFSFPLIPTTSCHVSPTLVSPIPHLIPNQVCHPTFPPPTIPPFPPLPSPQPFSNSPLIPITSCHVSPILVPSIPHLIPNS